MPTAEKHKQQYESNRSFMSTIDNKYMDWRITVAFYCAVHLVDKILAEKMNVHPWSHIDRLTAVNRVDPIKSGSADYSVLYTLSRKARYDCTCLKQADVNNAIRCLNTVENIANKSIDSNT